MHKIILCILTISVNVFINTRCNSQNSEWLQGNWEGKTSFPGSKAVQQFNILLNIYKAEGNKFEGIIKTVLPFDTSVHFDSKISGTFYDKYLILKRDSILYVKNPPGSNLKWETRCNTCTPPNMIFSIENGRFIFRGEVKGCLKLCNGVTEFSREMSAFDSSTKVFLSVLASVEQQPEQIHPDTAIALLAMQKTSLLLYHTVDTVARVRQRKTPSLTGKIAVMLQGQAVVFIPEANVAFLSQTIIRSSQNDTIVPLSSKNIPLQQQKTITTIKAARLPLVFVPAANTPFAAQTIIRATKGDTVVSSSRNNTPLLVQKNITSLKQAASSLPVHFYDRKINIIRTLIVNEDSVTLRLYDNGVVDGDIVSVIYNSQVIVDKLSLTSRAFVIKIPVNKTEKNSLVFHAENLGEFPPNTAKLEILYGNKKEELIVSSDFDISSTIDLIYHE